MQHKGVVFMALSAVFSAHTIAGIAHGEVSEFGGKNVRWQQLAEGVFTGVPEHEWDDKSMWNPVGPFTMRLTNLSSQDVQR